MTLSKSTRAELRRRCPTPEETDALLDMADERDRYRSLLRKVRTLLTESASWTEIKDTQADIDAALEGKHE